MPENTGRQHTWLGTRQTGSLRASLIYTLIKLACLSLNPQKSVIGGKTNKSEIRGGGNSFVREQRGPAMGLRPPEFGMNTEKRGERNAKCPFNNGHKKQRSKRNRKQESKSKEQLQTSFGL